MQGGNQSTGTLPELLTLRQAAELCGVSDRTLWTWAKSGASPAPLKIHKGTVRSCPAYVAWIAAVALESTEGTAMLRSAKASWQRVSKARPCPICNRIDWCMFTGDPGNPDAAICSNRIAQAGRRGGLAARTA